MEQKDFGENRSLSLHRSIPRIYAEPTFVEDFPNFILEQGDFTWRTGFDASVVDVGVLQYSLEDSRLEIRRRVLDNRYNGRGLCTSGAVSKRDGSVMEEIPGGVGRRSLKERRRF